jgi:hypothetical protein
VREDARLLRPAARRLRHARVARDRSQLRRRDQQEGRRVPRVQERGVAGDGHAAAFGPRPGLEARRRRQDARVHRRGHDRPHAAQREGRAEARVGLRRGRRASPDGLPSTATAGRCARTSRSACATRRRSA